jgi:hypothetical protein
LRLNNLTADSVGNRIERCFQRTELIVV